MTNFAGCTGIHILSLNIRSHAVMPEYILELDVIDVPQLPLTAAQCSSEDCNCILSTVHPKVFSLKQFTYHIHIGTNSKLAESMGSLPMTLMSTREAIETVLSYYVWSLSTCSTFCFIKQPVIHCP